MSVRFAAACLFALARADFLLFWPDADDRPTQIAMILPIELSKTLAAVGSVLCGASDRWWIIASAAAAVHGAKPINVADVDVLMSIGDARRILPRIGILPIPGSLSHRFRSDVLGTWRDAPLPVEFMAGFCQRDRGDWITVQPRTRQPMKIRNTLIFVPEREELKSMFASFGRPKDLERLRLLEACR